ncbi:hypothetical protein [Bacillus thuringiensis]|uniref:hypothetical protein n=1 Tax=Bacillus thuringiensis TaxID=1428 RepID=UPI003144DC8E
MGKSEMFQDFNFKLVVIEALLDKEPLFQNLKNLKTVEYISMCYPKVLEPFKQAGIEIED